MMANATPWIPEISYVSTARRPGSGSQLQSPMVRRDIAMSAAAAG